MSRREDDGSWKPDPDFTMLHEALQEGDAASYYSLCRRLGVDPEDEAGRLLYERGEADALFTSGEFRFSAEGALAVEAGSDLEQVVGQEDAGQGQTAVRRRSKREDVPYAWDVRKADLNRLGMGALDVILRGSHNLQMQFPMLDAMNPDEILAKWYGAGQMKKAGVHETPLAWKGDGAERFARVYKTIDGTAYSRKEFRKMAAACKKRYPHTRGQQEKRLMGLDPEVQEAFVQAFFAEYRPSDSEKPDHPKAYHTPNIDGRSKTAMVNEIYRRIEALWDQAAQDS